ncbi:MAG: 3'-5' exonuclease [Nitrosomonas sp.]|nr:3'-5' exonuclease [Nitrosomonas sp.]
MSAILSGLNPEQLEAVTWPHQSALVLAGAGSGKTRVLTTRIAYLLQSGFAHPHNILAVTFTNKAAREMLARISTMLTIHPRNMWVGTFHGLCNRMLRTHYQEAGLPQEFPILDMADQQAVIKRLLKAHSLDEKTYPPRLLQWFINSAKDEGLRASQVVPKDNMERKLVECYQLYETVCLRDGLVDFAELLLRCHELLMRNQMLRDHYRDRFSHILVDEFQDTNRLQYQWLKLLSGDKSAQHAAIFAVGDDDQSIYAFRGAHAGNMQALEQDFGISRVIKLEQNYRSHGNILNAANAVIQHNTGRLGKNLWTSAGEGEPVRTYHAFTDRDEAVFIVDEIKALHAEGLALSDIALLYRSNAQSRMLEHQLFNTGISYRVYGGMRFFDRQEIRHMLAYLRMIANPDDDYAFMRIVNFPTRGIGARTLEQLQDQARAVGASLWPVACQQYEAGTGAARGKNQSSGRGISGFVGLILSMRQACEALPLPEIVSLVEDRSGLNAHYQSEREGGDRLENLKELINAATSFMHESENDNLIAFLAHASLEGGEHQAGDQQDAVQLMTVHAAKGLEFPAVFICGLEEGLFPHENSRKEADGLEEERRLMYVAITRARQRLYLTYAQSRMLYGQTHRNIPSRFVSEIPDKLLKKLCPDTISDPSASSVVYTKAFNPMASGGKRKVGHAASVLRGHASGLQIGQRVSHQKFGHGTIINCEGSGEDLRVQVHFSLLGDKWLSLAYANLTPLEEH